MLSTKGITQEALKPHRNQNPHVSIQIQKLGHWDLGRASVEFLGKIFKAALGIEPGHLYPDPKVVRVWLD